ncbi:MAG: hypothetical protein ACI9SI_001790, partial [Polaribacter sp.]
MGNITCLFLLFVTKEKSIHQIPVIKPTIMKKITFLLSFLLFTAFSNQSFAQTYDLTTVT